MRRSSLFLSFPLYAATAILISATVGFLLYMLLFAPSSEENATELLETIQQLEADNEPLVDQPARQLLEMQRLKTSRVHSSRLPKENEKLASQVAGPSGEPFGYLASSTSTPSPVHPFPQQKRPVWRSTPGLLEFSLSGIRNSCSQPQQASSMIPGKLPNWRPASEG